MRRQNTQGYVPPEAIEKARSVDLLTYLKIYEPYELMRCGNNVYCTKSHDSLKTSNGKWFGGRVGSAALTPWTIL